MSIKKSGYVLVALLSSLFVTPLYAGAIAISSVTTSIPMQSVSTQQSSQRTTIHDDETVNLPSQADIDAQVDEGKSQMKTAISHYTMPESVKAHLSQDPRFPMKSQLTPGKVTQSVVDLPHQIPAFFVVGDDLLSRQWLKKQIAFLKDHHIVGFITNIDTIEALHELQQLFNIVLHPVSLDGLIDRLHVKHYPFWYENGVISQ